MVTGNATHQIAVLGAMGARRVTTEELAASLPIRRPQIVAATGRLVARGLVERHETGVFALSDAGKSLLEKGGTLSSGVARGWRKHPVYADSLRQRAWKAMRLSARFTAGDIAALAAKPNDRQPEETIRRFCHLLTLAGYLAELPARTRGTAASSPGFKQWRMIRDTGEIAPQHMAAKCAFRDRNTKEVFPCR